MENYAVEMLHITKRFPGIIANDDVTIQLRKGEIHALLGENGAGKSTLMSVLFGLYQPEEGEIHVDGKKVEIRNPNDANDLGIGMVHQHFKLVECFSVLDNIILPAVKSTKTKESRAEITDRALKLMKKLGIEDIANNDINEVSGGQLQRACICRSMINNPAVIFADEPTGALNRTSSDEVMEELSKLNQEGTTIMLVTHDAKVAAKCSRVLFIVDGNIKGEYNVDVTAALRDRERALNNWLMEMGF